MLPITPPQHRGDGAPAALIGGLGLVMHTTLGVRLAAPVPQLGLVGGVSVRTSGTVREALSVGYDGEISHLVIDDRGEHLERLARVAVPLGHKAVGAVRTSGGDAPAVGDQLLVFTYEGASVPYAPSASDEVGTTFAWTASVEAITPTNGVAALTVSAEISGPDVLLCWAPGAGAIDRAGWTLGGAPAARVITTGPADNCALVVRDHAAARDHAEPGGYAVDGPIPGVGRMRIGIPLGREVGDDFRPPLSYGLPERPLEDAFRTLPLAALTGGGFVNPLHTFGPGGVIERAAVPGEARFDRGTPDASGNGLWLSPCVDLCPITLVNQDGHELPTPESWAPLGPVGGGGLLVRTGGSLVVAVSPTGVRTPLPQGWSSGVASHPNVGALADGTACRSDPGTGLFVCIKDGVTRTSSTQPPGYTQGQRWYPLADGSFVIPDGEIGASTTRLDVATMTFSEIGRQSFTRFAYTADGALFALAFSSGGTSATGKVVAVTRTGFVEQPIPASWYPISSIAVDEELFILFRGDGTVARLPR